MKKFLSLLAILAFLMLSAAPLLAQQKRLSPHETISTVVDGGRVMVVYGRPYTKNPKSGEVRKIWGGLIPFGQPWRMGADESTLLIIQKPLTLGDAAVPAGVYSLYLLPMEDGSAKLIVNKDVGGWGTQYKASSDLVRVDLKKTDLTAPVDQFTMAIAKRTGGGGTLKLSWENVGYSVEFANQK